MDTLKDFNDSYIRREKSYDSRRKKLNEQVNELQAKMARMKYPTLEKTLKPIIDVIQNRLGAEGHLMYGPFGMENATSVYWVKDITKPITEDGNVLGDITFVSNDFGWEIEDEDNKKTINITAEMDIKWILKFVKRN